MNVSCWFSSCRELRFVPMYKQAGKSRAEGATPSGRSREDTRLHPRLTAPPGLAPAQAPVGRCVCGCSTTCGLIFCLHVSLPAFHCSCSFSPWSSFSLPALPSLLFMLLPRVAWLPRLGLMSPLAVLSGRREVKAFTQSPQLIRPGSGI